MKFTTCTFDHQAVKCPNCGEELTPAKYYTALSHERKVQPRRKSSGYHILSFSNIFLNHGGLCMKCGQKRSAQLLKKDSIFAAVSAIIFVLVLFIIFLDHTYKVLPQGNQFGEVAGTCGAIVFIVAFVLCALKSIKVIKWLIVKAQLKDEKKLNENKLSALYVKLSPDKKLSFATSDNEVLIFPITDYDYLQKEHKRA